MNLDRRLSDLEARFIDAVPRALAALDVKSRVYAVLLCWFDFSNLDEFRPCAVVAKAEILERDDADPSRLWSPQHEFPDSVVVTTLGDEEIARSVRACYGELSGEGADFEGGLVGDWDEVRARLLPFRRMLQRVAMQLNDEALPLDTSADFVVIAADWMGEVEDPLTCMSPEKLSRLRARGAWFAGA